MSKSTNGYLVARPARSAGTVAVQWAAGLLVAVVVLLAVPTPTLTQNTDTVALASQPSEEVTVKILP